MSEGNEQLDASQGNNQVWDYSVGRMVDRNAPPPEVDPQARIAALNTQNYGQLPQHAGIYANGTGNGDQADAQLAALRKFDPNAKVTDMQWVPGEADARFGQNNGHWQASFDYDKSKVPTGPKGLDKLDPKTASQFTLFDTNSLEDAKKQLKYGFKDDSSVYYDPEFGYYTHQDNIVHKDNTIGDMAVKYAPSAIIALGTMGMGPIMGPLMSAGLNAANSAANGAKFGDVLKQAGIGAVTGLAGGALGQVLPNVNLGPIGSISGSTLGSAGAKIVADLATGKDLKTSLINAGLTVAGSTVMNAAGQKIGDLTDDKFIQAIMKEAVGAGVGLGKQAITYPNGAQQQKPVVRPPAPRITYPTGGH